LQFNAFLFARIRAQRRGDYDFHWHSHSSCRPELVLTIRGAAVRDWWNTLT
jgi:hypothetical protein